ncbi:MAG: hypothetical protein ACKVS6_10335 [Planctomycetota bacterium]
MIHFRPLQFAIAAAILACGIYCSFSYYLTFITGKYKGGDGELAAALPENMKENDVLFCASFFRMTLDDYLRNHTITARTLSYPSQI